MKTAKMTLMFLACAAAIPAFAQNTTDSRCGSTNYDSSRNVYTITNPTLGTATQQCFITVVPKNAWTGGNPNLSTSQLVEGNYEITLSGGGGGGGGGAGNSTERGRTESGDGGHGGYAAVPSTTVRYLTPGVYRLTIGTGGQGGMAGSVRNTGSTAGGNGTDGGPTSLENAYSGETVAGYTGAESWNGSYPMVAQAAYVGAEAKDGQHGVDGGSGGGGGARAAGDRGAQGGNGFIKLALKDSVPQAAPVQAAPMTSSSNQNATTPAPAATRPARKDRN
jgi:hypothetical protein